MINRTAKLQLHVVIIGFFLFLECKGAAASDDFLIVADSGENRANLFEISLNTDEFRTLLPPQIANQTSPLAVEVDQESDVVYWTDSRFPSISGYRHVSANSSVEQFSERYFVVYNDEHDNTGTQFECLALDKSTETLYFCHLEDESGSIGKMLTDGTKKETFLSGADLKPRAIVLDKKNRQLYWSDWGDNAGIFRVSMNNPSRSVVIASGNIKWPNGLAIDFTEGLVFWADAGLDRIERCKLDGSERKTLSTGSQNHFFALTISNQFIFGTDWQKHSVRKISRDGGRITSVPRLIPSMPNGIVYISRSSIPSEPTLTIKPEAVMMLHAAEASHELSTTRKIEPLSPSSSTRGMKKRVIVHSQADPTPLALKEEEEQKVTLDGKILAIGILGTLFLLVIILVLVATGFIFKNKLGRPKNVVADDGTTEPETHSPYETINLWAYAEENSRNEMADTSGWQNHGTTVIQNRMTPASRVSEGGYTKPILLQDDQDGYMNPTDMEAAYCSLNCDDASRDYNEYSQILQT